MRRVAALLAGLSLVLLATPSQALKPIRVAQPAVFVPAGPAGPNAEEALSDADILKKAHVGADGKALLDYFRKRLVNQADLKQIQALIRRLGDDDFFVRQKAARQLIDLGAQALGPLQEAENNQSNEVEVRRRAEYCRVQIAGEAGAMVSAAVARTVAKVKPAGAAEVLLAYLPFAEDDDVSDEILQALAVVGVRDGKPDPALVKALKERDPNAEKDGPLAKKRAAAAYALCRANVRSELPAVRGLLKDPRAEVRLRAALGLVHFGEKEAVNTLIHLLGDDLPEGTEALKARAEEIRGRAEDMLTRLAGEKSPTVALGTDAASRKQCVDAWAGWWQANRDKLDLAKASRVPELKNYVMIVQRDMVWKGGKFQTGTVKELDKHKKVRWKVEGLSYPVDAQLFTSGKEEHLLVTEWQERKVTERDLKGKVLWTHTVTTNYPLAAQRLPNGNTFIVMQNQLLEVDKAGKQVFSITNRSDIMRARKLPNGDIAILTNGGQFIRMDKNQRIVKQFYTGSWVQQFGTFDVLPNGRVLVPLSGMNKVIEFTPEGKKVWEVTVQWPTSAVRLRNGNTLVSSQSTNQVIIFDRKGKVVWQQQSDGQVFAARGR